jgi:hypothetical protein
MRERIYAQRKRQADADSSAVPLNSSSATTAAVADAPAPAHDAADGHSIASIAIAPLAQTPAAAAGPAGSAAAPLGILNPDGSAFNPESIVHDLRRAIDQSAATLEIDKNRVIRKIDAGLVMRVLDNLTPTQAKTVIALYESQEKRAGSLFEDLFGGGTSKVPGSLTNDQEMRIRALLHGTRSEEPGAATTTARIEADVAELHELLGSSLNENKRERLMALHRRPVAGIGRIDD